MVFSDVARVYHLRVFLEVADQQSFSRAAELLSVSQPTVSNLIRRLEDAAGEALFQRGRRRISMTDAGQVLYGHAKRLVAASETMDASIEALNGAVGGRVLVGGTQTIADQLSDIFIAFIKRHPQVKLAVHFGGSQTMCDMVTSGQLGLAVVGAHSADTRLEVIALYKRETALNVIVPSGHPLASNRVVTPAMLLGYPFVRYSFVQHSGIDQHLREVGVEPDYVMEIESLNGVKKAVAEGVGIALLARRAMDQGPDYPVIQLRLDAPSYMTAMYAVRQRNRYMTAAEHALLDYIRASLSSPEQGVDSGP